MACTARLAGFRTGWRRRSASPDGPPADRIDARRREIAALLEEIRAPVPAGELAALGLAAGR